MEVTKQDPREIDKDMLDERTEMKELRRAHRKQDRLRAGHCLFYPRDRVGEGPDIRLQLFQVLFLAQFLWRLFNH